MHILTYLATAAGASRVALGMPGIEKPLACAILIWAMATILLAVLLVIAIRDRRALEAEMAQLRCVERPLCASVQRLQRAVDGSSDGYWEWNGADGTIWYSNRLKELFDLDDTELPDNLTSWLDALQPLDRPSTQKEVALQIESGAAFDTVYEAWSKDGRRRWFRARGRAVRGSNGTVQRMSGSIRDVSDKKAAEAALLDGERQLRFRQRMEAIGALAGGVAHEFNNLLHIIQSFTEFALHAIPANSEARDDLGHVLTSSKRAAALTRQLLEFSRSGPAQMQRVEANTVVSDLTTMLHPLIGEQVTLSVELDDVGHVNADKPLLQQALWNLCVNACEAMPTGGRLTIRTKLVAALHQSGLAPSANGKPSRSVEFSVADVGTGVPPEIYERIFEPFFTTKKLGKNCGLGLATAYGIVEQHGGTIRFESSNAFGSTFYILVPSTDCEAGGANWNDRESCDGARITETTLQLIDA